ncbi:MAG: hypothetical protein LBI72_12540 [Flavobacteriaceae bacterium]|jgi:beta-lactamase superfamily II metal-dependent hydrolase|nr:hypothetical protein [Flavobacteriaceae bacterium]
MELEVVNVGQGNLNVIKLQQFNLCYDLGAPIWANEIEVDTILDNNIKLFDEEYGVIISHWDVDHYRLIFNLNKKNKLKNMKFFICPNYLPNVTSIKAFDIVLEQNIQILTIDNIENITAFKKLSTLSFKKGDTPYVKALNLCLCGFNIKQRPIFLIQKVENEYKEVTCYPISIDLFHSVNRLDRNRNSLIMTIRYENKGSSESNYVIFTGDCYYRDLNNYVFPTLYSNINDVELIVPHHGGAAGYYTLSNLIFRKGNAIISVGKNKYGHPLSNYIRELNNRFKHKNVMRTDSVTCNILRTLR